MKEPIDNVIDLDSRRPDQSQVLECSECQNKTWIIKRENAAASSVIICAYCHVENGMCEVDIEE